MANLSGMAFVFSTNAQYDEKAKRLLKNKIILAHILVKTIDEFKGMNPKEVVGKIITAT